MIHFRQRTRLLVGVVLVLLLVPAAGWSTVTEGDSPQLSLPAVDGERVDLGELRGSVVLVDFWATWCEPCHDALPFFEQMLRKYEDRGLEVLAVSIDADRDDIREFARRHSLELPLLHDSGQNAFARFNPAAMPTTYFIDHQGVVRAIHTGFQKEDRDELESKIRRMLREIPSPDDGEGEQNDEKRNRTEDLR